MKGQVSIEYLIIVGFVTLVITAVLSAAFFYIDTSQTRIQSNQIEVLADKIISSSESVYYAGEPSQTAITIYFPKGLQNISASGNSLIIEATTPGGRIVRVFESSVPLEINLPVFSEGTAKVTIRAEQDKTVIEKV